MFLRLFGHMSTQLLIPEKGFMSRDMNVFGVLMLEVGSGKWPTEL